MEEKPFIKSKNNFNMSVAYYICHMMCHVTDDEVPFFEYPCIVRLDSILEVRVGQQTDGFEKFPYEEVAEQSFSLMYEEMKGVSIVICHVTI